MIGASLTLAGVVGFMYTSSFGQPGETDALFGFLDVNGWHNLVHLLSGLVGLALSRSYSGGRLFSIWFGAIYAAVALWGIVIGSGEAILGIIPVNSADNVLHVLISLAGIAAGLGTPATPRPSPVSDSPPTDLPFHPN